MEQAGKVFIKKSMFFILKADNMDRILHSFLIQNKSQVNHLACLGSWVLYNSLSIMNLYLITGFELELYSKYEYHYVYWYLCEIVLNWMINTLTRADNFILSSEQNFSSKLIKVNIIFKKKPITIYRNQRRWQRQQEDKKKEQIIL